MCQKLPNYNMPCGILFVIFLKTNSNVNFASHIKMTCDNFMVNLNWTYVFIVKVWIFNRYPFKNYNDQ